MESQQVAITILNQLGGRRFQMMTGAKYLASTENSLSFQFPGSRKANHVQIVLNPSDTYTVTFNKINFKSYSNTVVSVHEGIYCDQLESLFGEETGLATRLF